MKPGSFLLVGALLVWQAGAWADVSVSIDRSVITEQDSLTLTITATEGEDMDSVDFSALEAYFKIGSRDSRTQFNISNGRAEGSSVLNLTLFPRYTGNLEVPPLFVDGVLTPKIPVRVEKARTDIDSSTEVFVEAEVDREQVFVQAQLLFTVRSYQAVNTGQWNYEAIEIPGAVTEELDSRQYQRSVEGRTYLVIERRFAIFPQQSGELVIPSFTMAVKENLRSSGNFFNLRGNPRVFRPRTAKITVAVRPIPAQFPDAHWLPARDISLEDNWSVEPETLAVGGSATRTVTIKARGLNGNQLPQLSTQAIDGIRVYPDQPRFENLSDENGITGLGINSTALLVTGPGDYRLPAVRVPWWDTETDQLRYAEIPAREFSVLPGVLPTQGEVALSASPPITAAAANTAATEGSIPANSLWFWTTLATLAAWLLTTVLLLRRRSPVAVEEDSRSDSTREPQLFRELLQACDENRALETRSLLRQWAQAKLRRDRAPAISELGVLADDPQLGVRLGELEQSLYAGDVSQWRGGDLMNALRQWRKQLDARERSAVEPALAPLYN